MFWHNIDPLVKDRQFCDGGNEYRSAIFFHGDEQKPLGGGVQEDSRRRSSSSRSQTEIVAAGPFYKAEDYHQDYYLKNPPLQILPLELRARQRLEELWGKKEQS